MRHGVTKIIMNEALSFERAKRLAEFALKPSNVGLQTAFIAHAGSECTFWLPKKKVLHLNFALMWSCVDKWETGGGRGEWWEETGAGHMDGLFNATRRGELWRVRDPNALLLLIHWWRVWPTYCSTKIASCLIQTWWLAYCQPSKGCRNTPPVLKSEVGKDIAQRGRAKCTNQV